MDNAWSIGQIDSFTALTPAVFTSPTIGSGFLNVGVLHIGDSNIPTTLIIKPTRNVDVNGSGMYADYVGNTNNYGIAGFRYIPGTGTISDPTNLGYTSGIFSSRIYLGNSNSELVLDSSGSVEDITFDTPATDFVNGVASSAQEWGVLTINAQAYALTLTTTSTNVTGQTSQPRPRLISNAALKTLNINGNGNVTLDLEGYVSTLNLNNPAPQILFATPANPLNGTAASMVNLHADAHLKHSIDAHGITINFNTFELDLSPNTTGGTIRLGSDQPIVLNTTFDQTSIASGTGGHLLLNDSSTLDLSAATQGIQVNFTTSSSVLPPARREFSYKVIDPGTNSFITFGNTTPTFNMLGTQNTYSTWHFNPATYTIYSKSS